MKKIIPIPIIMRTGTTSSAALIPMRDAIRMIANHPSPRRPKNFFQKGLTDSKKSDIIKPSQEGKKERKVTRMKKMFALALVLVSLFSVASAEIYPAVGVVTDLDYEHDLVIFEDYNQNLWIFEGIEDWDIGDIGALLMDDMETESIYDDMILLARYAGFMPEQ